MTFYTEMAETASELLAEFGTPIVFPRTIAQSIHPVTGTITPGSDGTVTGTGLVVNMPTKYIDGTLIKATDKLLILAPDQTPVLGDKPTMGGNPIGEIVQVLTSSPIGINLVHKCALRS